MTRTRRRLTRRRRAALAGQVLVPFAIVLLVLTVLLTALLGGLRESSDYRAIQERLQAAALAGAGMGAAGSLVTGSPTLACAAATCAGVAASPCPDALAADPDGATAAGRACLFLRQALAALYGGPRARVDVTDALAHARVAVAQAGQACPDAPEHVYHFATLCLTDDPYVGILAHDGLGVRFHMVARAQIVYR